MSVAVAVLLPPAVVPPLVSLVAPVVTVTVTAPEVVGVPVTGQTMLEPAVTVAGGAGTQAPTVRPAGRPATAHEAAVARRRGGRTVGAEDGAGVGDADAGGGGQARQIGRHVGADHGDGSGGGVVAAGRRAAVGVVGGAGRDGDGHRAGWWSACPLTGQEMVALAATVAGGTGVQAPTVTPAGRPEMLNTSRPSHWRWRCALLRQRMVPAYAVPTVAEVGRPVRSGRHVGAESR